MALVYVGIGSNMGDRQAHIAHAERGLRALPRATGVRMSPVYETAPVGPIEQGPYLNAAAELTTDLDPFSLLDALNALELAAGRPVEGAAGRVKWGPRPLDLDILLYGDRVISHDELIVPHPLMHERWFVLKPLCDLNPAVVHPVLEMTVGDLLREACDESRRAGQPESRK